MKNVLGLRARGGSTLGTQVRLPPGLDAGTLARAAQEYNGGDGGGGGGYYVSVPQDTRSDKEILESYVNTLYSAYKPAPLVYEEPSADSLLAQIEAWLRPSYEQAILKRQERTRSYRAELDADAISRGMGVSSYVSDVKSRQMEEEADDIAMLESEYGAQLAHTLNEQLAGERERALEVAMFNRQNDYDAYMRAYSAALTMFSAYKAKGSGGGGYYVSGETEDEVIPTTPENCDAFLRLLSPEERSEVYAGSTDQGQQYRDELIASVGLSGFYALMGKYRGAN